MRGSASRSDLHTEVEVTNGESHQFEQKESGIWVNWAVFYPGGLECGA